MQKKFVIDDFTLEDAGDMPKIVRTSLQWQKIFAAIPKGKMIVIEPEQISASTVRSALRRYQAKGNFTNLKMTSRKVKDNQWRSYVANP